MATVQRVLVIVSLISLFLVTRVSGELSGEDENEPDLYLSNFDSALQVFVYGDTNPQVYAQARTNCVRLVRHYFKKIFKYFGCFTKYWKNILEGLREWMKQARLFLQKFRHAWFIRMLLGFGEIFLELFVAQM